MGQVKKTGGFVWWIGQNQENIIIQRSSTLGSCIIKTPHLYPASGIASTFPRFRGGGKLARSEKPLVLLKAYFSSTRFAPFKQITRLLNSELNLTGSLRSACQVTDACCRNGCGAVDGCGTRKKPVMVVDGWCWNIKLQSPLDTSSSHATGQVKGRRDQ